MSVQEDLLKEFGGIRITREMKEVAEREIAKREPDIVHHFKTEHYTQEQTDMIGFYGEFALRVFLGLDWKAGIRPNYKTINSHDVLENDWAIDVKTESIPKRYIWPVIKRSIPDNEWFGRRLYHIGQKNLIEKYDILVIGATVREESFSEIDAWFPIGWLPAKNVTSYPSGNKGPMHYSGRQVFYPFPAFQIKTADLQEIGALGEMIKRPKHL